MKNLFILLFLSLTSFTILAQDEVVEAEMLGDNFSLEGALELLKKSESLEAFEKSLNEEGNEVNNLDLNEDEETDYVRVEDIMENDVHVIVLQAVLREDDVADIATIELERTGDESATLQIVGNEELYGEEYIVEPYAEEGQSSGNGPNAEYKLSRVVVNVWFWPSVRYVYRPGYKVYVSPFRWRVYPGWYRPYTPRPFRVFAPIRLKHIGHYHVVKTRRVAKAGKIYAPKRKRSVTVSKRTTVVKSKKGTKVSRSKTKTTSVKKNGKTKTVKKTRTKTKRKKGNK